MNSLALAIPEIAVVVVILLVTAIIINRLLKFTISLSEIIYSILAGLLLTILSLVYRTQPFYSGTGTRQDFGWPHFFYTTWQSFEGTGSFQQLVLGGLGAYAIINILFYGTIVWLAYQIIKTIQNYKSLEKNKLLAALGIAIAGIIIAVIVFCGFLKSSAPAPIPTNSTTLQQPDKVKGLPSDVLPEQIGATYEIDNALYAMALEPNSNYALEGLRGKAIAWHGVLQSVDKGQSWTKFFTITDPDDPQQTGYKIKHNPVGVFSENGKLYVDIADDRGAGSGEGNLIRFSSSDNGNTWSRQGCYYFVPEKYYPNFNNFINGRADTSKVDPRSLETSNSCTYNEKL